MAIPMERGSAGVTNMAPKVAIASQIQMATKRFSLESRFGYGLEDETQEFCKCEVPANEYDCRRWCRSTLSVC